ncbi:MAG: NAD(P)-dependent oxidoreductase [Bacteroidota bacterium]
MTAAFIDTVHPILMQRLHDAGYACIEPYHASREELKKLCSGVEGIVIRSRIQLDRDFLDHCTSLKWIARSGAGMENIDITYAASKGIHCFNSPEGNRDAVGEQAIGMLLMLFNNLLRADREVRNGIWKREENRGVELAGKTVGIIGYGPMGKALAKKLIGFDCKILVHDKYLSGFGTHDIHEVSVEEIQENADIISFHLPLTEETHFYFDEDFLAGCSKPLYLINTARGAIVNTDVLLQGLKSGRVLGSCLDVLEFEQFNFEQLRTDELPAHFRELVASDKVVLSPHIAGWTHESYYKLSSILADKILEKHPVI